MAADATTLFEQLQGLPDSEREIFLQMCKCWQAKFVQQPDRMESRRKRPDFMARLRADFPNGVPRGKPVSEIVDEGRGPRP